MSLKGFHIFFITVSTLLAFGFAAWCARMFINEHADLYLGMGGTSFMAGIGLIVYGVSFLRKIKHLKL